MMYGYLQLLLVGDDGDGGLGGVSGAATGVSALEIRKDGGAWASCSMWQVSCCMRPKLGLLLPDFGLVQLGVSLVTSECELVRDGDGASCGLPVRTSRRWAVWGRAMTLPMVACGECPLTLTLASASVLVASVLVASALVASVSVSW